MLRDAQGFFRIPKILSPPHFENSQKILKNLKESLRIPKNPEES